MNFPIFPIEGLLNKIYNKKVMRSVLVFFFIAGIVTFGIYRFILNPSANPPVQTEPTPTGIPVTPLPMPSAGPSGEINVLLLGQGDPSHEGSSLTDSLMVIHLDTIQKKVALIFLPRDLWVQLPVKINGKSEVKINEVYRLGLKNNDPVTGLKFVEQTVSALTGIPIQYSVLIDFNGFTQVLNYLGGIDININSPFDDYYYPIIGRELDNCGLPPEQLAAINATMSGFNLEKQYSCRYEHLHFNSGKTHVDGETALKFARSRHSSSDYARGERQQIILIGLKDKLISLEALKNVDKFYNNFVKKLKHDIDLEAARSIASMIINPKEYQITQIIPSDTNVLSPSKSSSGQFILIPKAGEGNWTEFQDFIKK